MVEWFIFIIHGLVYDFIVANLSCCCLEYYIDDEITMLIDDVLGCVGWFLDGDMKYDWDDVFLWLELTLCEILRFTFIWAVSYL